MRVITQRRFSQGDTLIEVLLAITIFSAAAVGAIYIMNRGISTEQQSLEITQVRNQINNQAELLRHLNNLAITASGRVTASGGSATLEDSSVAAQWYKAIGRSTEGAPSFDTIQSLDDCHPSKIASNTTKPFFINTKTGQVVPINEGGYEAIFKPTEIYAQVRGADDSTDAQWSEMVWIYAVNTGPTAAGRPSLKGNFYDFHIRACWESPEGGKAQKLGTIVRLYAPEE